MLILLVAKFNIKPRIFMRGVLGLSFSSCYLLLTNYHGGPISNRLREDKLRSFFPSLMKVLAHNFPRTLHNLKEEDPHFHMLSEKEKLVLEKVLKKYYSF